MRLPWIAFSLLLLPLAVAGQPYFPVKINKKWGLIDSSGRLVAEPVYDALGQFKQFGYAVMQRNGGVGLLDEHAREILPPIFYDLKVLGKNLVAVFEHGDWRVINLQGQTVLEPGYERVEPLAPGFLAFRAQGRWGIVHASGKRVAPPAYDAVSTFEGGYFLVFLEDEVGLVRRDGHVVLPPCAEEIETLAEGLFFFLQDHRWGAVDSTGRTLFPARFQTYAPLDGGFIKLFEDGSVSVFSLKERRLLPLQPFDDYLAFSEDFLLVQHKNKVGLINLHGEVLFEPDYEEIQAFTDTSFRVKMHDRWGVLSLNGVLLLPFEFDYIAPLKDGTCLIMLDGKQGVANARGEILVSPDYDKVKATESTIKAWKGQALSYFQFDEEGNLRDSSSFSRHLTIKIGSRRRRQVIRLQTQNDYVLDRFEWFFDPRERKWGLRNLEDGSIQIRPAFHTINILQDLGLTLVGIETIVYIDVNRTTYRMERLFGLVNNQVGLLIKGVDLIHLELEDFEHGWPLARCIYQDGTFGLIDRIGRVIHKDLTFVGPFREGRARVAVKGRLSATLNAGQYGLGRLRVFMDSLMTIVTLVDYTLHDQEIDRDGELICEGCSWGFVDTTGQWIAAPQYSYANDFVNGVSLVERNGKWGMLGVEATELIPCRYDGIGFLEKTDNRIVRIFKREEKYGLIDTLGRLIVNLQYEKIGSFSEGRLAVKRQGLWGFTDAQGREVIPCRFRAVQNFSEGLAAVRLGSKWGYIDKQGNVVLEPQFAQAGNFVNGLAPVKFESEKFGYIDTAGNWALAPQYDEAYDFDRGVARVKVWVRGQARMGLIDRYGEFLVRPRFLNIEPFDRYGRAVVTLGNSPPLKKGLIDLEGHLLTSHPFREIHPFHEGLARVKLRNGYGFIDLNGQLVIPPRFSQAGDFHEERAYVKIKGKWGYIDPHGKLVIDTQFSRCHDFEDGKAVVFKGQRRAGLIDREGRFIIRPSINRMLDFREERGRVRDESRKFYYITAQAKIYDGFYDHASRFQHGVAVVQVDGRWGIINQRGIEIIPPKYDRIESFQNGYAKVRIEGFTGLSNLDGKLLIQPQYEYITYAGQGLFRVEKGEKIGYLDYNGNWVWDLRE